MASLNTRLTRQLDLQIPLLSAPMAFASGGALAAAVSRAGGLGLIGGGYGDALWIDEQFAAAAGARVGVGFITWSLSQSPALLTRALVHRPVAVMLSFGDPRPFADEIHAAGARLVCQCQNLGHVRDALEAKADIVVAQGAEDIRIIAGGVIPQEDIPELQKDGVAQVFLSGTPIADIIAYLVTETRHVRA